MPRRLSPVTDPTRDATAEFFRIRRAPKRRARQRGSAVPVPRAITPTPSLAANETRTVSLRDPCLKSRRKTDTPDPPAPNGTPFPSAPYGIGGRSRHLLGTIRDSAPGSQQDISPASSSEAKSRRSLPWSLGRTTATARRCSRMRGTHRSKPPHLRRGRPIGSTGNDRSGATAGPRTTGRAGRR